jgi:hypothetical protein
LEELRQLQSRPIVLLLEAIFTRDQHIIDEWQAAKISDAELKNRLRYALEWGYEWEPFLHTLKIARGLSIPILGADCAPRGNRRQIGRRDRHAAEIVARTRRSDPHALVVVFFGESHLAPSHLPREIEEQLPREDVRVVLQNVDQLYFRAAGELVQHIDALRVSNKAVAVFNATPLEKWQSYRLCIERWREESRWAPDFTPLLYDLIDALLELLHIESCPDEDDESNRYFVDCYPEVVHLNSLERGREVLRRGLAGAELNRRLLELVEDGSCYVPELNLLVVYQLRMAPASKHVARFVYQACRGFEPQIVTTDAETGRTEDAFYARILEHAFEHFGAHLLYPSQPIGSEDDLLSFYEEASSPGVPLSAAEYVHVLDCALLHRDYELHAQSYAQKPPMLRDVSSWSNEMRELLALYLGQLLGSDLYRAYLKGTLSRIDGRSLMFRRLAHGARGIYFSAARRVRRSSARLLAA